MLKYKGYTGQVEFDDESGIFHGEVLDLRDVITFQGRSVEEIEQAFRDSIDDYLDFCQARGEEPDKPFSGRLMLRLPSQLHRVTYVKARREGKSLNQWIAEKLEQASHRDRDAPHRAPLPHHAAYGSVLRGSADQAESDPGGRKPK